MKIEKDMYDEIRMLLIFATVNGYDVSENTRKLACIFNFSEELYHNIENLLKK